MSIRLHDAHEVLVGVRPPPLGIPPTALFDEVVRPVVLRDLMPASNSCDDGPVAEGLVRAHGRGERRHGPVPHGVRPVLSTRKVCMTMMKCATVVTSCIHIIISFCLLLSVLRLHAFVEAREPDQHILYELVVFIPWRLGVPPDVGDDWHEVPCLCCFDTR